MFRRGRLSSRLDRIEAILGQLEEINVATNGQGTGLFDKSLSKNNRYPRIPMTELSFVQLSPNVLTIGIVFLTSSKTIGLPFGKRFIPIASQDWILSLLAMGYISSLLETQTFPELGLRMPVPIIRRSHLLIMLPFNWSNPLLAASGALNIKPKFWM